MSKENGYWEVGDRVITREYKDWAWNKGTIGWINRIASEYEGKKLPEDAYQVFFISLYEADGVTHKSNEGTYWTTPEDVYRYDGTPNEVLWSTEDVRREGIRRFNLPDNEGTVMFASPDGIKFIF